MHSELVIVLSVVGVGLVLAVLWRQLQRSPGARRSRLEGQFLRMTQMPPRPARELLERTLAGLAEQYPGRSRQWRLRKAIYDLKRDRQ